MKSFCEQTKKNFYLVDLQINYNDDYKMLLLCNFYLQFQVVIAVKKIKICDTNRKNIIPRVCDKKNIKCKNKTDILM